MKEETAEDDLNVQWPVGQYCLYRAGGDCPPGSQTDSRGPDLGPKWVRLASNGTNPGLFQIIFQYILAHSDSLWAQMWPP